MPRRPRIGSASLIAAAGFEFRLSSGVLYYADLDAELPQAAPPVVTVRDNAVSAPTSRRLSAATARSGDALLAQALPAQALPPAPAA